jgi:6-phosphofructo-2-kinase/fructose-2,6-biphosphatase 4
MTLATTSSRTLTPSQIIPSSYNNVAKRIKIPELPESMVPGSPEDIQIPVPPSGAVSPLSGMGTPQAGSGTATPQHGVQPLNLKAHVNPSS